MPLYLGQQHPGFPPTLHSPLPRFRSQGPQLLIGRFGISNTTSPQLSSWFILPVLPVSGEGRCFGCRRRGSPVPAVCRGPQGTSLHLATESYNVGNCKLLAVKMALRSGGTGLRGRNILTLCGPTTRTWNIFAPSSISIPEKIGGPVRTIRFQVLPRCRQCR